MKERPILFQGAMVRALLDGSKTQTRRIVKPLTADRIEHCPGFMERVLPFGPYGQPGDRLWVRESFWGCDLAGYGDQPCVVYDDEWIGKEYRPAVVRPWGRKFGRIPSIHMPRDCSRILLEVVAVRVERLNDISDADARAEGGTIEDRHMAGYCAGEFLPPSIRAYRELWESINGAGSWATNPFVWCVEFRRVQP